MYMTIKHSMALIVPAITYLEQISLVTTSDINFEQKIYVHMHQESCVNK